jgi:HSP20 family protein
MSIYFEFQEQPNQATTWVPTVDVCERADEIVILVEIPGVDRSDMQIAWNEGFLIISGLKRQRPSGRDVAKYLCVERSYGHFRREIAIKIPIDYKNAKAELKNGLLRINLPKRSEPDVTTIPIL